MGENGGKGITNKKHKQLVQNRQGEVKNSMGNGEAKEITWWERVYRAEGNKGEKKNGTTLIAKSIKYILKNVHKHITQNDFTKSILII